MAICKKTDKGIDTDAITGAIIQFGKAMFQAIDSVNLPKARYGIASMDPDFRHLIKPKKKQKPSIKPKPIRAATFERARLLKCKIEALKKMINELKGFTKPSCTRVVLFYIPSSELSQPMDSHDDIIDETNKAVLSSLTKQLKVAEKEFDLLK